MLRTVSWIFLSSLLGALLVGGAVFAPPAPAAEEITPIFTVSGIETLKVGAVSPDFTLKDLKGTPYSLADQLKAKKGAVIFFWSIFCEPCKAELPIIQELTNTYQDRVDFTGIILDGLPMKEAVAAFIKQEKYTFRTLLDEMNEDESFKVSDPYGVAGTPTLYILDAQRNIKYAVVGREKKEKLEAVIKTLL